MELIKRENKEYGFTLRKTTKPSEATVEIYLLHLAKIFDNQGCTISNKVFEQESGLHCHGVVNIPTKFNMKKFRIRGWNLKLEELYDAQGWYIYCNKHEDKPLPDMDSDHEPNSDFKMPTHRLFKPVPHSNLLGV